MFKRSAALFLILFTAITIQGCMLANKPFKPEKLDSNMALIYIYRPESIISRGINFSVTVNGKIVLKHLINHSYVYTYVKPGTVNLVLKEDKLLGGKLHDINFNNLKAGKAYYIKAEPALFGAYELEMKDESVGKAEIRSAKYFTEKTK